MDERLARHSTRNTLAYLNKNRIKNNFKVLKK
jgi:hypothetical protein